MPKKIKIIWDDFAKEDLKIIYKFNKKKFSVEFAQKVHQEIYDAVQILLF